MRYPFSETRFWEGLYAVVMVAIGFAVLVLVAVHESIPFIPS